MSNNLALKVTADVADAQAKLSVLNAEFRATQTQINSLARAGAAGNLGDAGTAELQQLSTRMLELQAAAQPLAASVKDAGFAVTGLGAAALSASGSVEQFSGHNATAVRYARELFDEFSSGRTRYLPSTLAALAQQTLHMSGAMLAGVGGAAALTAGLGYLIYEAVKAERAIQGISASAQFLGNMNVTTSFASSLVAQIKQSGDVGEEEAEKTARAIASIQNLSNASMQAIAGNIGAIAQGFGTTTDKAAGTVAKILDLNTSVSKLSELLPGLTADQVSQAQATQQTGNYAAIVTERWSLLTSQLQRMQAAQLAATRAQAAALRTQQESISMGGDRGMMGASSAIGAQAQSALAALQAEEAQIRRNMDLTRQMAAQPLGPQATQNQLKTAFAAGNDANPLQGQLEKARQQINEIAAGMAILKQEGDQTGLDRLNADLVKAKENLTNLQFGPVVERMRDQMSQVAANWDGTQSGMLERQREIAAQSLAQVQAGSKEYLSIQQEMARLSVQIRQQEGQEAVAAAKNEVAQLSGETQISATQRLQAERSVWQQLLAGDRLTASQRIQVQQSLTQSIAALNREYQSEGTAIAQSNAQTDVAISKMKIEAQKEELQAEVSATKEAAAAKYQALKELTDQEYALDLKQLQDELATLGNQPVEYARVYNQIRTLKQQNADELTAIDRQQAEAARQSTAQQASDWRGVVSEIERSESGMVQDILTKRRSLSQDLLQIGSNLVSQEIANDLRAVTTRLLLSNSAAVQQKAIEQGGYLYHLLTETQKTVATQAGETARTAATITGNTAQTAAVASAAATQKGVAAAAGASTIQADAAKAFAGTYAAVAQIPYVGWIMAPIAASAAYAGVMAYEGLASLAVGTFEVPQDMIANIHRGEMVVPRTFADGLRSMMSGGGSAASGSGGDTHYHHHGDINLADTDVLDALDNPAGRDRLIGMIGAGLNRGARP